MERNELDSNEQRTTVVGKADCEDENDDIRYSQTREGIPSQSLTD